MNAESGKLAGIETTGQLFAFLNSESCFLGLDIGSTTIKAIGLDHEGRVAFQEYVRHFSNPRSAALTLLRRLKELPGNQSVEICVTGSGGIGIAGEIGAPFIQEVLSCQLALAKRYPDADVAIELGGEDAKLTYLTGGLEQRMNETCAGGTGAFIDQMAAFLGTDAEGLDHLALQGSTIYPIASRCGVFAKSDVLPLLNEGCLREDVALSIMQAVVAQTISGLAQGRSIEGKVIFLGGPLHFLKSLRQRFVASLDRISNAQCPEDAHFFVAYGAALHSRALQQCAIDLKKAIKALQAPAPLAAATRLPPLFNNREEVEAFRSRHAKASIVRPPLEQAKGNAWLGFDCGSTTLKSCLVDDNGRLLHSTYQASRGDPLPLALETLREIRKRMPEGLVIAGSCATGYGSAMLANALGIDFDEVETVAHAEAAFFFNPQTTFILDIGGQDIKCLHLCNGLLNKISLNEACSAGCGSFIENFAESLKIDLGTFVEKALLAQNPANLGTRCTVFMNSKVKQAQKEGATLGNIAAGLSYSVIRNALHKVMRIRSVEDLGNHVVAQGGAFQNDALLRALELELGKNVIRPSISGLMGAFGAALLARKRANPGTGKLLSLEDIEGFSYRTSKSRCAGCANNCRLTISSFNNGGRFVSGNRCERANAPKGNSLPNLHAWKYKRLFDYYIPNKVENAPRGVIGLPRALNIFENYPLWFTLFHELGFRVQLSSPSSKALYFSALDTIPSQTVCYPAKLAHGHLLDLANRGIKNIFFPCVPREQTSADFLHGSYNCPVVAGYPELLAKNIRSLKDNGINLIYEFLPLDPHVLPRRLARIPLFCNIPFDELRNAVMNAFAEMSKFRLDLRKAGDEAMEKLGSLGKMGLILAGHPYHIDPEIGHGIAELVNSCGLGVLTEDSIIHHLEDPGPMRVVDQWAYHSRLYRAGAFTGQVNNLAVLQLVSFGCGLDAITSDQLEEIVVRNGRLYGQIKIDEGQALGPARIRIRSLYAAMRERLEMEKGLPVSGGINESLYPVFQPEMRHTHILLVPQLSPLHFQFAREIFASDGYEAVLLPSVSRNALELGLKHVNNDACYPAIVVIGQLLEAVKNGGYDPNKVALVISQTGGGCRATNYVAFLRKALNDAGFSQIPIVNFSTSLHGPGIRLNERLIRRLIMAGHYGDAFLRMLHRLRPYERDEGSVESLIVKWSAIAARNIESGSCATFNFNILKMIREFDRLPLRCGKRRQQVGLVGEILLKYHPDANNNVVKAIEAEGGEAVTTDIMDFILYSLHDQIFNYEQLAGSKKGSLQARMAISFLEVTRMSLLAGFGMSKRFNMPVRFKDMRRMGKKIVSLGHHAGEGWLLASEMARMLENGINKILCLQPFGCLPNHIVGKGLIRELKSRYPHAVITPLDYDPGASEVNQINRIKLMMRGTGF